MTLRSVACGCATSMRRMPHSVALSECKHEVPHLPAPCLSEAGSSWALGSRSKRPCPVTREHGSLGNKTLGPIAALCLLGFRSTCLRVTCVWIPQHAARRGSEALGPRAVGHLTREMAEAASVESGGDRLARDLRWGTGTWPCNLVVVPRAFKGRAQVTTLNANDNPMSRLSC